MRTNKQLMKLAKDIREGRIFGSWNIPENQAATMMPMVFMTLAFIEDKHIEEYKLLDIQHFYEYESEALSGRAINGYPIFFSHNVLSRKECEKITEYITKLNEAEDALIDDELNPRPPLFSTKE